VLLSMLVCAPLAAKKAKAPPPPPKVVAAMLVLAADNADLKLTKSLRAQIVPNIPSVPKLKLLTGKALAKAIKANPQDAFDGCGSDLKCIAALGEKANVQKIVLARVTSSDSGIGVTFVLVNVATGTVENKVKFSIAQANQIKAALAARLLELLPDMGNGENPHPTAVSATQSPPPSPGPASPPVQPPPAQGTAAEPAPTPAPAQPPEKAAPSPAVETVNASPATGSPAETATPLPAYSGPQNPEAKPGQASETVSTVTETEWRASPTTSRLGTRGIERVESAWSTRAKDIVISLGGDAYSGNKLLASNDTDKMFHQQLFLTWAPVEGLDLTVSESFASNNNSVWKPAAVVQTLGSPTLGAKYGMAVSSDFAVAAAVRALIPTSLQGHTFAVSGTSVAGLLCASYRAASFLGLSLNLGYLLDRSDHITSAKLTTAQRFALGISAANQATAGLGVETDWGLGGDVRAGPFAELTSSFGVGAKLRNDPIRATAGAKIQPLGPWLEVSVGGDFALEGKATASGSDMAGIPPWDVFVRLAGHLGPWITRQSTAIAASCSQDSDCSSGMSCHAGRCVIVTEVVRIEQVVKAQATYRITGKVTNKNTKALLDSASVTISGYESSPLVVNRKTGEYVSFPLPCGEGLVQLTATGDGFHQEQKTLPKGASEETKVADFTLQPASELMTAELTGSIKDATTGKPVLGGVFLPVLNLQIKADKEGHFKVVVNSGRYEVLITAPGYLTQKKEIHLRGGDSVILNIDMNVRSK